MNWFGAETTVAAPHGLWARNYQEMMDQMLETGFNAIRLPFSSDMVLNNPIPSGINTGENPDLVGLTALEVFDKIIDYADEIGLRILLDHHRNVEGNSATSNGLWYGEGGYTEADWIDMWEQVAARYGDSPAVIGADLHLGATGANGPVVANLLAPRAPGGGSFGTDLQTFALTGADLTGPLSDFPLDALIAEIEAGNVYFNVRTSDGAPNTMGAAGDNPDGEIRAQLTRQ